MSTPLTPPLQSDSRSASQTQPPLADTSPSLNPEQPAGEAIVIVAPPPSYAAGPGIPARIPHIGHALLFISFAGLILLASQASLIGLAHPAHDAQKILTTAMQPKLLVLAMAAIALHWREELWPVHAPANAR